MKMYTWGLKSIQIGFKARSIRNTREIFTVMRKIKTQRSKNPVFMTRFQYRNYKMTKIKGEMDKAIGGMRR